MPIMHVDEIVPADMMYLAFTLLANVSFSEAQISHQLEMLTCVLSLSESFSFL